MGVNGSDGGGQHEDVVVRKGERGWVVGDENVSDLTSAMVLADLFAADQAAAVSNETGLMEAVDADGAPRRAPGPPAPRRSNTGPLPAVDVTNEPQEAERLAVTVAQLEHALASRVRVEQAIGVLAERHRLHPREAFDLLRQAARSRGSRVTEMAQDVVASAANPLIRLPEELSRKAQEARTPRGVRSVRRGRHAADR
jgi:ANTAR domain